MVSMVGLVFGAVLVNSTSLASAQEGREALRRGSQAWEGAEFQSAVELLSRGLDPSAGPRDSLWVAGVHMLADALIEQGATSLADVWLRWAVRLELNISVDSINFPPSVTHVFDAARTAVRRSGLDSGLVTITWEWSRSAGAATQGAIRVREGDVVLTAEVQGAGSLRAGADRTLPAGHYTVVAGATDHLPARIATEVLPGVTTVLDFKLEPSSGFLYVVSRPWGEAYLDGQRIGYTTIAALKVEAGSHRLLIERDGYVPFDTTITIQGDQRLRLGPIRLQQRTPSR